MELRPRVSQLVLLWALGLGLVASALEIVHREAPELTCSQGLTDCQVSSVPSYSPMLDLDDTVNVVQVELEPILCCLSARDCVPCLRIIITVQDAGFQGSGHHNDEDESGQVVEGSGSPVSPGQRVLACLSSPGSNEICKILWFRSSSTGLEGASQQPTHQLLLTERVMFGSPVVVHVHTHSEKTNIIENITIPSLEEVCSMSLEGEVKECDAPRLQVVTDDQKNVVLQLEEASVREDELMCQLFWNEIPGEILAWPKGKKEMVISSNLIVPCLCFQVWWWGKEVRRRTCPFKNKTDALERMRHNVSVSMEEPPIGFRGSGLSWNVTAPCRLEAELWLCRKDPAGGKCEEVMGSRQTLHSHTHAGWRSTRKGHWNAGEFNGSSHPLLCVQLKIHGTETHIKPHCPFSTSRWRWSLPLLIVLLLLCLAMLGAYFIQGVIKGYVWRWLKDEDVKGAVGGGHVVLLYPPDDDQALPELMSHLGSSLQALGFSVSLDLWSQSELSALGPIPWLHSRLNQLQKQGGKVVLVLTQGAWIRAEEWGARSWERNTYREKDMEKEEEGRSYTSSHPAHVDVFSASLSCILADYLQGRAGERFMLVQLELLPPEPPGGFRPLPELFRGLHLYSLPSQSLGFLTELAGSRQMATASARRKRAGGLRMASRVLARGLSGFASKTTVLRLTGVSQSCVGIEVEDSGETLPLQPCLVTPPSSPDTNPRVNKTDWV